PSNKRSSLQPKFSKLYGPSRCHMVPSHWKHRHQTFQLEQVRVEKFSPLRVSSLTEVVEMGAERVHELGAVLNGPFHGDLLFIVMYGRERGARRMENGA